MIYLIEADETTHLPLIMAWRSTPLVYKGFYQQRSPLIWESHVNWFRTRNSDWRTFVIMMGENNWDEPGVIMGTWEYARLALRADHVKSTETDRPIGVVTIGQLDHWSPEIGYFIGETTLWGKGLGTEAVQMGIEWIMEYSKTHRHISGIHTTIKDDNIGSIKLIKKLGFKKGMKARNGEHYYFRGL